MPASTPAWLIVNADDFGLTTGTNQAIIAAHQSGIVTSTSLLANGEAFEHAVQHVRDVPTLGVGVHLTLTEGLPVGRGDGLPLDAHGALPLSNQPYARALLAGKLPQSAIQMEFRAQVQRILDAGIRPTHVDGHKYIHLLPGIADITAEVAREFAIPVVRTPHRIIDPWHPLARQPARIAVWLMAWLAHRAAQRSSRRSADFATGFAATGHLTPTLVLDLLRRPRAGLTELVCHPAFYNAEHERLFERGYAWIKGYDFAGETAAVSSTDLRQALTQRGWTFASFATPLVRTF